MSKTCDILIGGEHSINIGLISDLGLVIVSDKGEFGEHWIEVRASKPPFSGTKHASDFTIRILAGHNNQNALEVSRYLAGRLENELCKKNSLESMFTFDSSLKFTFNICLRQEILDNRTHIKAIGDALEDLASKV